ncbi:O-antigen polymerase [Quatrionicoccus australiensis]|uniref:O-antigen polymerase n=1 Tax=Quatrionicoccus australiensis TaxID=138118 RepID=UPI001CF81D41|nr:O-antigen polymerase [Quatrionicoccus australiensis]UCV13946.1 oligosaccharide repeat unit polymerase [Quatrionicoccus australiensis]
MKSNFLIKKSAFSSPSFVVFIQWTFLLIAYQASMADLQKLNPFFLVIVATFVLFMVIGEWFGGAVGNVERVPKYFFNKQSLYVISCISILYTGYLFLMLVGSGGFESALDFRETLFYTSDSDKSSLEVGVSFPLVAASLVVSKESKDKRIIVFFSVFLFFLAILSTSKMYLFLFAFFMFPSLNRIRLRHVLIGVVCLFSLFALSHIVLEKYSADPEDGITDAVLKTFEVYLLSGIGAFQIVLNNDASLPEMRSFYGINQLLPIKLDWVPNINILPWVSIDYGWMTNIYTALGVWWNDFGLLGVAVISFFIGFAYKIMWSSKTLQGRFMTTFSLLPLLFTFFEDYFLMSLKTWVVFYMASVLISFTRLEKFEGR